MNLGDGIWETNWCDGIFHFSRTYALIKAKSVSSASVNRLQQHPRQFTEASNDSFSVQSFPPIHQTIPEELTLISRNPRRNLNSL